MTAVPIEQPRHRMADGAVAILVIASCAITPRWFGVFSYADVIMGVILVATVIGSLAFGWTARQGQWVVRLLPPLWFLILLELITTLLADSPTSSLLDVAKDLWSLTFLLVPLILLGRSHREDLRLTRWAVALGAVGLSVWVIVEPGARPAGPFPDPTYTGSWLAMAGVLATALMRRSWLIVSLLTLIVIGLVRVQSFAAVGSLFIGLVILWMVRSAVWRSMLVIAACVVGVIGPMVGFLAVRWLSDDVSPGVAGSALSHLHYTAGIRWEIWSEVLQVAGHHPWGIGPGQFSGGGFIPTTTGVGYETHNTFLEVIVELGWLGLIGYLWLLKRLANGGAAAASAAIVAVICQSAFHNTFNFRHLWLMVAVAIIASTSRSSTMPVEDVDEVAAEDEDERPQAVAEARWQ